MENLGTRIKKIRESKHMSINELANKSGLSDSYLGRLENGQRRDPSISTVIKMADALNISVEEIIRKRDPYIIKLSTVTILDSKILIDNYVINPRQKEQLYEFLIDL